MIPIHVNKLELEMTRLCNGKCRHCMRGHEQNISLSKNIIDNIFRKDNYKIVHISYLFLTGGEVLINKENLIYLLNYLIENNIRVSSLGMIINSTIYEEEVIKYLNELRKKGTLINIESHLDQFHPQVKKEILAKYQKLSYYSLEKNILTKKDIISIGNAQENNIGSKLRKNYITKEFAKVLPFLEFNTISYDCLMTPSLYVTTRGKFGSRPTDATWDMIDHKYYLDINQDNLFTDCIFRKKVREYLKNMDNYEWLPQELINDYHQALKNHNLNNFLENLDNETLRSYFTNKPQQKRTLSLTNPK